MKTSGYYQDVDGTLNHTNAKDKTMFVKLTGYLMIASALVFTACILKSATAAPPSSAIGYLVAGAMAGVALVSGVAMLRCKEPTPRRRVS
jgi:hypothetical protein